jgi:hypothetical protein
MSKRPSNLEIGTNPLSLTKIIGGKTAYNKLPTPYKNDQALNFYTDQNGDICAQHLAVNEEYLFTRGKWIRI